MNWFKRLKTKAENPYTHTSNSQQVKNYRPRYQDNVNYSQNYNIEEGLNEGLDLASNNPVGSGIVSTIVNEAIGNKLNCESSPDLNYFQDRITDKQVSEIQKTIETYFDIWQNNPAYCDYYNSSNLGTIERQATRMAIAQGEIFAIIRIVRCGDIFLPQTQLINPLLVCSPNYTDTENIVSGIEFDDKGRETAYYVKVIKNDLPDSFEWKRIPKFSRNGRLQMIHAKFNVIDPAQARGRSLLTPIKDNLVEINRYIEASIVKAEQQANIAYSIEKDINAVEPEGTSTLEELSNSAFADVANIAWQSNAPDDSNVPLTIRPGMTLEMRPGEHLKMTESNAPSQNFWEVLYAMAKITSSHTGTPAEKLFKSYVNSYSASQAAMQESHSNAVYWRNQICDSFLNVLYEQFVWCLASQKIVNLLDFFVDDFAKKAWSKAQWFGSAIIHNDPVKAVNAAILRVQNNFSTYEFETRNLTGLSFDAVCTKVAEERKRIKELNPNLIREEIKTDTASNTETDTDTDTDTEEEDKE